MSYRNEAEIRLASHAGHSIHGLRIGRRVVESHEQVAWQTDLAADIDRSNHTAATLSLIHI